MRAILKGSTDQSVVLRALNTDGTPATSFDHATAGIDLWYRREGATKTSITEAALAALDTAHTDGGVEYIGDGYFRLDPPDAAFATGADGVVFGGTATSIVIVGGYTPLVGFNPQDAVRLGLTALPNAAADAAGGLPISDAGGLNLDAQIGTDIDAILADTGTDGVLLTATERNATADAILNRDMATGTDSGSTTVRTVRQALRFLRNKWAIVAGTLTVYKEDDSTSSWTGAVTGTAGADPATSMDPAGP